MSIARLNYPLFVFMGASGSGKSSVSQAVFGLGAKVVSHTTRPRRPGEREGDDYYFESLDSFAQLEWSGELLEKDDYNRHHYGVGLQDIIDKTTRQPAYVILTYQGYQAVYQQFPEDVIAIVMTVKQQTIRQRLHTRGDQLDVIKQRIALFEKEQLALAKLQGKNVYQIDATAPFNDVVAEIKGLVSAFID